MKFTYYRDGFLHGIMTAVLFIIAVYILTTAYANAKKIFQHEPTRQANVTNKWEVLPLIYKDPIKK